MPVKIFTDGSYRYPKPENNIKSKGGWAIDSPYYKHKESGSFCPGVSPLYSELYAVEKALDFIIEKNPKRQYRIWTDCLAIVNVMNSKSNYRDIYTALVCVHESYKTVCKPTVDKFVGIKKKIALKNLKVEFVHIRSHTDGANHASKGNRRVDKEAKKASKSAKC